MLHFWMRLFGRSEPATHALSMVAGLLAIPAAWWSGDKLFGRRAARGAAALVATCAYLDYYSTETRMYSWLVLFAILAVTCFVLAYRGAGRRYWVSRHLAHGRRSLPAVLRPVPSGRDGDRWFGGRRSQPVVASLESGTFVRVPACAPLFCPRHLSSFTSSTTRAPRGRPARRCSTSSVTRSTRWRWPRGQRSSSPSPWLSFGAGARTWSPAGTRAASHSIAFPRHRRRPHHVAAGLGGRSVRELLEPPLPGHCHGPRTGTAGRGALPSATVLAPWCCGQRWLPWPVQPCQWSSTGASRSRPPKAMPPTCWTT